ncbi:hypothetical protein ACIPSH_17880 [Streptomyces iakyrus]|uniref:hypothetical protein n=1 Tax=Streptomyces iakyrus TaxID=68219 RepID=UPI0037FC52A4
MRTEMRRKRIPFISPKPDRLKSAIREVAAVSPNASVSLTGITNRGSVRATGVTFDEISSQLPDFRKLDYLRIVVTSNASGPADVVKIELGVQRGISRFDAFRGWFQRVQEWDIRLTVKSASAHEADRLLAATVSVLRANRIAAASVAVIALVPPVIEVFGLSLFVALLLLREGVANDNYQVALFSVFYWRLVFFLFINRSGVTLRPNSSRAASLLTWHPSARAQALWTVIGGMAGLVALVVAVLAWLAPKT